MLDERKASILRAVVEEYIKTAQPVGSSHVVQAGVPVSSATVRNEMAVLEREGYLIQPHTSAGRIPTDKGYRFFVDHLMPTGTPLPPAQLQLVKDFFTTAHGELEEMLHDTSRLLSVLTDYAAVVAMDPTPDEATIRSVHLVELSERTALLVVVLSNGMVEKRTLELSDDVGDGRIVAAGNRLASHLVGRALSDPGSVPHTGDAATDAVVDAAMAQLASRPEAEPEHLFVGGVSRMAAAFDAVDTVRQVLTTLEQQYVVVTLLRDLIDRGLSVAIGNETGLEQLAKCAIVIAPYRAEGAAAGTIGVVGPTRMNYPRALAAVSVVSQRLDRYLAEG